ncbi:hypothetical protein [Luedemannella flava]
MTQPFDVHPWELRESGLAVAACGAAVTVAEDRLRPADVGAGWAAGAALADAARTWHDAVSELGSDITETGDNMVSAAAAYRAADEAARCRVYAGYGR